MIGTILTVAIAAAEIAVFVYVMVAIQRCIVVMAVTPVVLRWLRDGERSGRDLQDLLAAAGLTMPRPAFYAMMASLEKEGHVRGWYHERVVGGQPVRERRYALVEPKP